MKIRTKSYSIITILAERHAATKRCHYLRVDGVELSQYHSIDLVEATRRGVIRQGLPSARPSRHKT